MNRTIRERKRAFDEDVAAGRRPPAPRKRPPKIKRKRGEVVVEEDASQSPAEE
jgi:hypothetical protein